MSNKGLSKHTLSNFSKKKPKLPRHIKKGYEEHTFLTDSCIRHRKYDTKSGYKIVENYLETKIGCNWDEVYSELKSKIGDFKVEYYIKSFIVKSYKRIEWNRYGKLYTVTDKSIAAIQRGEFYIDSDNLLQQVSNKRIRNRVNITPTVIKLNDDSEYRYWSKHGWYYYYKKVIKEVKKKLVVNEQGKPVFYNKLNYQLYKMEDPILFNTPVFIYETVEKVTWEGYSIEKINSHKLKLRDLGVII